MMHPPYCSPYSLPRTLGLVLAVIALTLSCSPPVQRPTGAAGTFEDAKEMFKRGRFDRALEFTDRLVSPPPDKFTERAQVLRTLIFTGQIKCYKELVDAYGKGAEETNTTHFKAEYGRLRTDNLQYGARAALGLAETSHQLTVNGTMPKELTLEASYPATEGVLEVKELLRVREGGWIEPEQQESAALDSLRKGIDDALADFVSGDRAKARTALASGSVKIDGVDFALFLGKQLLAGASLFDRKHIHDSQKLKTLCNEADTVAKAALLLLKDNPDKDKEKAVKNLQDEIKSTVKKL